MNNITALNGEFIFFYPYYVEVIGMQFSSNIINGSSNVYVILNYYPTVFNYENVIFFNNTITSYGGLCVFKNPGGGKVTNSEFISNSFI